MGRFARRRLKNYLMTAADVEKFRVVFDMCDAGVRMYRQRMRRENPAASDEEIEARVAGVAAQAEWRGGRPAPASRRAGRRRCSPSTQVLRQAAADLDAIGARWAVIGGLAVAFRAEPRFTKDVDVAVAVADDR